MPAAREESGVRIDHLIVGARDLDAAVEELSRRTGVRASFGGEHPGRGTHNALLSLGDGAYLEILAPNPREASTLPVVGELQALENPTPIGWAVTVDDVARTRSMLEAHGLRLSPTRPGSRERPDGGRLEWETFGIAVPEHALAPFFIRWGASTPHPSTTSPAGCTLRSLSFTDPQGSLASMLSPLELPVTVSPGPEPRMRVVLSCPGGTVEL